MSNCPCCSDRLLRHIRKGSIYWFCRSCWAEMPNLEMYRRPVVPTPVTEPSILEPAILKPLVRSGRSTELQTVSHFTKVIQHQRPSKMNHHLLVS